MTIQPEIFDTEKLSDTLHRISEKYVDVFASLLSRQQGNIDLCMQGVSQAGQEFTRIALENPESVVKTHISYLEDYFALCKEFLNSPEKKHASDTAEISSEQNEQQDNNVFEFIKRSYQLMHNRFQALVNEVSSKTDPATAKKLNFYSRYMRDAISPSNFISTNPDVLKMALASKGESLVDGYKNFLADLERNKGFVNIKMTDLDHFKVGENIAITAGKVVYKNDIMELIQYAPLTESVYENPVLIIPPWINKYYILDLQPENSFVRWLVTQGHTVFLISWVNPIQPEGKKIFSDYVTEGPIAALKVIKKCVGKKTVNLMGYCVGGTLLGCTLSYLAQKKNDWNIASATFLTTLLDFSEPGDLGVFIDEPQLNALEKQMQEKGYFDGNMMSSIFNSLRPNDLIWKYFINNYLKGTSPAPFDLLYWNSDPTNIPEKVHSFYLREMYLRNNLTQAGAVEIASVPLDLKKINIPCYFLAAHDDHIVPWFACYKSMRLLTAPSTFVLTKSGHVAGVINPPHKNKYGYWVSTKKPKYPEKWLAHAEYCPGSWWGNWQEWLAKRAGDKVSALHLTHKSLPALKKAPGDYVKVRLVD